MKIEDSRKSNITTSDRMKIGQTAIIKGDCLPSYKGMLVLMAYKSLISLTKPDTVWFGDIPDFEVELVDVQVTITD